MCHLQTMNFLTGQIHSIKISNNGHTIIKNYQELCLIKYLPQLMQNGIYNYIIDARDRGHNYTKEIIKIYQYGLQLTLNSDFRYNKLIQKIEEISNGQLTNNNF